MRMYEREKRKRDRQTEKERKANMHYKSNTYFKFI